MQLVHNFHAYLSSFFGLFSYVILLLLLLFGLRYRFPVIIFRRRSKWGRAQPRVTTSISTVDGKKSKSCKQQQQQQRNHLYIHVYRVHFALFCSYFRWRFSFANLLDWLAFPCEQLKATYECSLSHTHFHMSHCVCEGTGTHRFFLFHIFLCKPSLFCTISYAIQARVCRIAFSHHREQGTKKNRNSAVKLISTNNTRHKNKKKIYFPNVPTEL